MGVQFLGYVRWQRITVGCLFLCAMGVEVLRADTAPNERKALIEAWNHRQHSVHTLHVVCSGTHFGTAAMATFPFKAESREKANNPGDMSCQCVGEVGIQLLCQEGVSLAGF